MYVDRLVKCPGGNGCPPGRFDAYEAAPPGIQMQMRDESGMAEFILHWMRKRIMADISENRVLVTMRQALLVMTVLPAVVFVGLLGCHSSQDKASESTPATVAVGTPETSQVAIPHDVGKADALDASNPEALGSVVSDPKATATKVAAEKPKLSLAVPPDTVPTTAVVPTPRPTATEEVIPDSVVAAAKAAFENNKCGACHSVGTFAAAKAPATKRDLSGVGLIRSSRWIAGFLQKKEKINGKLHMKLFGGSDAELAALSEWLAAQKTVPVPAKTSSTN